jgi:hypothetical protein
MGLTGMRRPAVAAALGAAALAIGVPALRSAPAAAPGTVPVDAATAAAGLTFAPDVATGDRAWILAAVAAARPEARALLARIDGLVRVETVPALPGDAVGLTTYDGGRAFVVSLDLAHLDGRRAVDRQVVVLHELGHVVDQALVPPALAEELDAGIPRGGACTTPGLPIGACAPPAERFADTFAKWALRGAVSEVGAGYAIPMPASLESWGAPLARL